MVPQALSRLELSLQVLRSLHVPHRFIPQTVSNILNLTQGQLLQQCIIIQLLQPNQWVTDQEGVVLHALNKPVDLLCYVQTAETIHLLRYRAVHCAGHCSYPE